MVQWPWRGVECKHLIKYNGQRVEISSLSFQGFELGKLDIKPELLQSVSHALMLIDASQYHFCEAVKNAPDEDSKKKYYDYMMQDKMRVQDVIMGLSAFTFNPQSKLIEETLMKMLIQNHNRALQIEEQKIQVPQEEIESTSHAVIDVGKNSFRDKITEVEKSEEFQKAKAHTVSSSKIETVGLFYLLKEKFNLSQLKTLCFEYGVDYDDIPGENKEDKARELILDVRRKEKLSDFYEFVTNYLERRG
jgi:hypothetical protein